MIYWYAAAIQPRAYELATFFLDRAGFQVYDPFVTEDHREVRLFPGYLLIGVDDQSWYRANRTPGVIGVLPIRREAKALPPGFVDQIRGFVDTQVEASEVLLKIGDLVDVDTGPFAGHSGRIIDNSRSRSTVLEILLFRQPTRVEVAASQISRKSEGLGATHFGRTRNQQGKALAA